MSNHPFKADAVLQAIRAADVGSDVIIHNEDGSVFCILTVKVKEHPEHSGTLIITGIALREPRRTWLITRQS